MKAATYDRYGSPDVLSVKEVNQPVPKDDEVLIKVHAASINSWDWDMVRGKPYIVRIWGVFRPRYRIPGADVAGRVVWVGRKVRQFKPGDEVFADLAESGFGAYAEYTTAPEKALTLKPPRMTFEQAAALPQAGALALQTLRFHTTVKEGDRVLINGAGGGVGTLGIQIAKSYGAEVTVVDKGDKLDRLRRLGADHVIDYTHEDFTASGRVYDIIMDVVANRSLADYRRALAPEGRFFMVGGTAKSLIQAMLLGPLMSTGNKKLKLMAYQANQGMQELIALYEQGQLVPVIDKVFPLRNTAPAFHYFGENNFVGKVVISMAEEISAAALNE